MDILGLAVWHVQRHGRCLLYSLHPQPLLHLHVQVCGSARDRRHRSHWLITSPGEVDADKWRSFRISEGIKWETFLTNISHFEKCHFISLCPTRPYQWEILTPPFRWCQIVAFPESYREYFRWGTVLMIDSLYQHQPPLLARIEWNV